MEFVPIDESGKYIKNEEIEIDKEDHYERSKKIAVIEFMVLI